MGSSATAPSYVSLRLLRSQTQPHPDTTTKNRRALRQQTPEDWEAQRLAMGRLTQDSEMLCSEWVSLASRSGDRGWALVSPRQRKGPLHIWNQATRVH